jgi:hypothetical protein
MKTVGLGMHTLDGQRMDAEGHPIVRTATRARRSRIVVDRVNVRFDHR